MTRIRVRITSRAPALSPLPVLSLEEAVSLLAARADALRLQTPMRRAVRAGVESAGIPRLFTIEDENVEELQQAELEWVERLVQEIENGSLEGVDRRRSRHVSLAAGHAATTRAGDELRAGEEHRTNDERGGTP